MGDKKNTPKPQQKGQQQKPQPQQQKSGKKK